MGIEESERLFARGVLRLARLAFQVPDRFELFAVRRCVA